MDAKQKDAVALVLGGSALEAMLDVDVDAVPLGEMALTGAALTALGKRLTDAAKDGAELVLSGMPDGSDKSFVDAGVSFQWRDGYKRVSVKAAAVKKAYPQSDYPDFYTTAQVRGGVALTMPKAEARR